MALARRVAYVIGLALNLVMVVPVLRRAATSLDSGTVGDGRVVGYSRISAGSGTDGLAAGRHRRIDGLEAIKIGSLHVTTKGHEEIASKTSKVHGPAKPAAQAREWRRHRIVVHTGQVLMVIGAVIAIIYRLALLEAFGPHSMLRQYFPKGTDLARWSAEDLEAVAHARNTRPRKTLDWKTPAEAFNEQLLLLQQAGVASTG